MAAQIQQHAVCGVCKDATGSAASQKLASGRADSVEAMPQLNMQTYHPLAIFDGIDVVEEGQGGGAQLFDDHNIGSFFHTNLDWPAAPHAAEEWQITRIGYRTNIPVDFDMRLRRAYVLWTHAACIRLTIAGSVICKLPFAEMPRLHDLWPCCHIDAHALQEVRANVNWMRAETDNLIHEIKRVDPRFRSMVWVHIDGTIRRLPDPPSI